MNVGERNTTVGDWLHVVEHLRRGLQRINNIAKHVLHHHLKGVLVGQRCREVDLPVNRNTAACGHTIRDGINQLPAAVSDMNLNVQVLKEGVGKDTVVDFNRVFHPVSVSVRQLCGVQREGSWRSDAGGFNVNGALGVSRPTGRVITVSDGGGVPGDDPNLVREVSKARNQTCGDVVHEIKVRDAPQAVRNCLCDDDTVELALVSG